MTRRLRVSRKGKKKKTRSRERKLHEKKEAADKSETLAAEVLRRLEPTPEGHAAAIDKLEPEQSMVSGMVAALQRQRGNTYVQDVMEKVQAQRGKGRPLDDRTREEMEEKMGQKLDKVRVHDGGEADQMNRDLGAQSVAAGGDLFFRSGAFSPSTKQGKELLAHELAHVVQQRGTAASAIHGGESWVADWRGTISGPF